MLRWVAEHVGVMAAWSIFALALSDSFRAGASGTVARRGEVNGPSPSLPAPSCRPDSGPTIAWNSIQSWVWGGPWLATEATQWRLAEGGAPPGPAMPNPAHLPATGWTRSPARALSPTLSIVVA
jgi:hypothetical protein